ncbi:DUF2922 domain-containing protein [Alkalicella caledoniensis]|uniref:DUF2922 domain-containing protein n=1 Tax=Alkalicella caledoniensis TaxID=2731377 RepID=A0A7G9W721_ALKCA|nr:DUF2922 domain-containing protein [Alkalicella caledoniensis]QNO14483.1 DUF2922 domain-containing protein [Alkalicella caledoniensis]
MPTTTLQMIFKNAQGRNVTISVADPIEPMDSNQVQQAMEEIISKDVFTSPGGDLVEVVAARLVARQVTEII